MPEFLKRTLSISVISKEMASRILATGNFIFLFSIGVDISFFIINPVVWFIALPPSLFSTPFYPTK